MKRTALAMWQGGLKSGRGSITIQDGRISDVPFSYQSRFKGETALNPEGLIAAAHAASFAMSLARILESQGLNADRIDTAATVKVEELNGVETVTQVDLEAIIHTTSTKHAQVLEAANRAKMDCSISRLINSKVTLSARVEKATDVSAA